MSAPITGLVHRDGETVTGWPIWQHGTSWYAGIQYTTVDLLTSDGAIVSGVKVPATGLAGVRVRDLSRASDGFLRRIVRTDLCGQGARSAAELAWRERQALAQQAVERQRAERVAALRARVALRAMAGVAR